MLKYRTMNELSTRAEYLQQTFAGEGIRLDPAQTDAFITYADLLAEKNAVMNLTAITQWEDVVHKHFLDSCAPARLPWFPPKGES